MGSHDAADAEEGSVAERGENARAEKQQKRRGHRAQGIADQEHAHQNDQRAFAVHAGERKSHQRRPQGDAECIAGNENACLGDAHPEAVGEVRQQPHDDEFRCADPER